MNKIYSLALTPENIRSGFAAAGLSPFLGEAWIEKYKYKLIGDKLKQSTVSLSSSLSFDWPASSSSSAVLPAAEPAPASASALPEEKAVHWVQRVRSGRMYNVLGELMSEARILNDSVRLQKLNEYKKSKDARAAAKRVRKDKQLQDAASEEPLRLYMQQKGFLEAKAKRPGVKVLKKFCSGHKYSAWQRPALIQAAQALMSKEAVGKGGASDSDSDSDSDGLDEFAGLSLDFESSV